MTKKDYIKLLERIALMLELKGENTFKVSAYRKAAGALEQSEVPIDDIEDFKTLPNIGKGVSEVLDEFRATGASSLLTELEEEVPQGHIQMLKIRNLGAKKIVKIYKALGITDIDELKAAAEKGDISSLPGFGKKSEESILAGIEDLEKKKERLSFSEAARLSLIISETLSSCPAVKRYHVAGSHRRMEEFSKDLDFIIETDDPQAAADEITALDIVTDVEAAGKEKVSAYIASGDLETSVDFRFTDAKGFIPMLNHFTGSKDHNVILRQKAKERGEKVNEYGIQQGDKLLQYQSEKEIYAHFGYDFIPPEMRGNIKCFDVNQQEIITREDIKGDLHMHTTASDGAFELEQMIEACIQKGYEYMVITDHSRSLRVANGLQIDKLLAQNEKIKKLNKAYSEIDIYSGTEMDILPDGTLDYPDDVLKELDYVIAAIHQSFNQPVEQIMMRLGNACDNPYVRQIAHPTGRLLGDRAGYPVDIEALILKAQQTGTVLEINANPLRLDLSADHLRGRDIKIAINTDAHHTAHLDFMTYGVGTAIKGFVKKVQVINALPRDAFADFLMRGKN